MKKSLSVKQIAIGGVLLAILIASQFFKNLSVYITGPIVNAVLLIATLTLGPVVGIILSVIAPITSFIITGGSPILIGIPLIIPAIMIGNSILCVVTWFIYSKFKFKGKLEVGLVTGSLFKAAFMGAVIVKCLLPLFSSDITVPAEKLPMVLKTASTTFSVTQLITSLIGSVFVYIIWLVAGKYLVNESK